MVKKKVKVLPGCIGCGLCEVLVPKIFKVNNVSKVNETVDSRTFEKELEEAVESCPVKVIVYEEE